MRRAAVQERGIVGSVTAPRDSAAPRHTPMYVWLLCNVYVPAQRRQLYASHVSWLAQPPGGRHATLRSTRSIGKRPEMTAPPCDAPTDPQPTPCPLRALWTRPRRRVLRSRSRADRVAAPSPLHTFLRLIACPDAPNRLLRHRGRRRGRSPLSRRLPASSCRPPTRAPVTRPMPLQRPSPQRSLKSAALAYPRTARRLTGQRSAASAREERLCFASLKGGSPDGRAWQQQLPPLPPPRLPPLHFPLGAHCGAGALPAAPKIPLPRPPRAPAAARSLAARPARSR